MHFKILKLERTFVHLINRNGSSFLQKSHTNTHKHTKKKHYPDAVVVARFKVIKPATELFMRAMNLNTDRFKGLLTFLFPSINVYMAFDFCKMSKDRRN